MAALKNKIGNFEFHSISTPNGVPSYGETLAPIERPGVDGTLWARQGKRGERFMMETVSTFDRLSDANDAITDYNLLRSQVVEVTLNNRVYSNILILSVRSNPPGELIVASNDAKYEVKCQWEGYVNA